jgi:uncharacterized membrane protein
MPSCVVPRSTFPGLPEDSAGPIDSRSVLLTCAALCLVVVLIYTTIDQMRPSAIIEAIRVHVLDAREKQLPLLKATRRRVSSETPGCRDAAHNVGAARLRDGDRRWRDRSQCGECEERPRRVYSVRAQHRSGAARGVGELRRVSRPISRAEMRGPLADTQSVENSVIAAIILENERDLECDPDLGIAQLAIIGWTSVSTARSNPNPGILVCHALRDILARWLEQGAPPEDLSSRIVYEDRVPGAVIATLESLSVAASESMQHQTLAEILRTLASLLPKLSREGRNQVADVALRTLSSLGKHVLTRGLEHALDILVQALTDTGCDGVAKALTRAKEALHQNVGVLNARSTRVPRNGAPFHHPPRE